jgi:small subunit ribosomal protein S2
MKETGDFKLLTKKEQSKIEKEVTKLREKLRWYQEHEKASRSYFVVDPNNERIAIKEANNLNIPVVAITDTNCDPDGVDFVVPGNDDAIKSITAFTSYFSNAVAEGSKGAKKESGEVIRDKSLEKEILEKYEKDVELKMEE